MSIVWNKSLRKPQGSRPRGSPTDWRSFQDSLRQRNSKSRARKLLLSLSLIFLVTTFFALSIGALWREKGQEKSTLTSDTSPPQGLPAFQEPANPETPPRSGTSESTDMQESHQASPAHDEPHLGIDSRHVEESQPSLSSTSESSHEMSWSTVGKYVRELAERLDSKPCLNVTIHDTPCRFCTSLDKPLQSWVENRLSRTMAVAGVAVAMDPATGRILTIATYNRNPSNKEGFFWNTYPAASLFKIVTAAAALDRGLLQPDSLLSFNGHPYTLFRSSLSTKVHPWTSHVTLSNAFARSLNPVFGKIGIYLLGPETLSEYGSAFLFNHTLPTEIPLETSHLEVPNDTMGLAEIASGLNHVTRISPVHAAWIGCVIIDGGAAPMPWLIEKVEDDSGKLLYRHNSTEPLRVITTSTAQKVRDMMKATITEGTCKRRFAKWKHDPILRDLELGGKTGNVNNQEDTRKFDWFVGYGLAPDTGKKVVLSVLLIHGYRVGHRANVVGYDLLHRYFE